MVHSKALLFALSLFNTVLADPHGFSQRLTRRHRELRRDDSSDDNSSNSTSGNGFISAAYFANWDTDYTVDDIPVENLSHIVYSFANIASDGTVSASDPGTDGTGGSDVSGNFEKLFELKQKNRGLKVTLSLGGGGSPGWKSVTDDGFSSTFVKSAVSMVNDLGLDGLDLDFEFPSTSNIAAYNKTICALRSGLDSLSQELNTSPFSISIAVAGDINDGKAYEKYIPSIDSCIDWWNVMVYDLCAPTYQSTTCPIGNLHGGSVNGAGTIQWYIQNGATASKMILGGPLYGYVYSGTKGMNEAYDQSETPKGDGVNGPGGYGVKLIPISSMKGGKITEDLEEGQSYAYDSDAQQLASYDTPTIAKLKANYTMAQGWGGTMYWEISSDGTGSASLVSAYASVLKTGGIDATCNHIDFPKSKYGNIASGMGNTAASCDGTQSFSGSSSSSSSSDDDSTTSSSSDSLGSSGSGQCSLSRKRSAKSLKKRLANNTRTN